MIDRDVERFWAGLDSEGDPHLWEPPEESRPRPERPPEQGKLFELTDAAAFDPER